MDMADSNISQDPQIQIASSSYDLGAEHTDMTKKLLGASKAKPVTVTFNSLTMAVQVKDTKNAKQGPPCGRAPTAMRTILAGINGVFEAGKFTAIMGASGAGKTTLLNAVAGEAAGGHLSGSIQLNGGSVDSDTMRRVSAFVFQDDVVLSTMTVREAITMSAKLRLPRQMPLEEKLERVEQVIEILHLDRCKDTIIGNAGQHGGVSGGERKRCSIAMELITNPSVIFLDEPTSGCASHPARCTLFMSSQEEGPFLPRWLPPRALEPENRSCIPMRATAPPPRAAREPGLLLG
jgi:ABC-type lipoprotein export system ATPase subunit